MTTLIVLVPWLDGGGGGEGCKADEYCIYHHVHDMYIKGNPSVQKEQFVSLCDATSLRQMATSVSVLRFMFCVGLLVHMKSRQKIARSKVGGGGGGRTSICLHTVQTEQAGDGISLYSTTTLSP